MILLDCGNSQLKAQYLEDGALRASLSLPYRDRWEARLLRWIDTTSAGRCYLTSVLDPARQQTLDRSLESRFGGNCTRFVSAARTLEVKNAYPEPASLGDDRWLALIGAAELVAGDCIVIDAGSAITVDLLCADGQHLGGAILPGFDTSPETFKRIFNYIDFDDPGIERNSAPGCSTAAAIQLDYGNASQEKLPALVERWTQEYLNQATVLLAGGGAARAQALLSVPGRILPDLVFRGMRRLIRL